MSDLLQRVFMPSMPAERLALLRIAIGLYVVQDLVRVRRAVLALGHTDPRLWDPVGVTTLMRGPLDPLTWEWVHDITLLVACLWTVGVGWRLVAPVFAGLLLFVWTYRVSWQMLYHVHHLTMLHVLVLSAAPSCAGALSVDRWWRRRRGQPAPRPSWVYGWPVQVVSAVTVLSYWLAGYAKVNVAGWTWAAGDNLLQQVGYDALYKALLAHPKDEPFAAVAFAYQNPWIMTPLALFALGIELGAPLVMLHQGAARVWSVLTLGMHWGIHVMMNLVFPYHVFGLPFLSFFPLERLLPGWARTHDGAEADASPDASEPRADDAAGSDPAPP